MSGLQLRASRSDPSRPVTQGVALGYDVAGLQPAGRLVPQPEGLTHRSPGQRPGRVSPLLLLLPLLLGAAPASDADLLADADRAFADGVAHRHDAAAARKLFRRAAAGYDELWRHGHRSADLTVARGRAHRLAGDLPRSVAAFAAGHAADRSGRAIRVGLEDARSAVVYPLDGALAAQCRPPPAGGVSARMSAAEGWGAAAGLWLAACLAVARWAMTRVPGWLTAAAVCLAGLAVLGGLWWDDARRRDDRPVVVAASDVALRTGNADSYPPRLDARLPAGVEARERARRGGWVQVELAGGAVGWLPGSNVIPADR